MAPVAMTTIAVTLMSVMMIMAMIIVVMGMGRCGIVHGRAGRYGRLLDARQL
jgi:hypothetical protein